MNDAEVVKGDVRELRAARAIAHRPDILARSLQPFVDLDIAMLVELDAGQLETDSVGIRLSARRNQKIGTFDSAFAMLVIGVDSDAIARTSLDLANFGSSNTSIPSVRTDRVGRRRCQDLRGSRVAGRLQSSVTREPSRRIACESSRPT